MTRNIYIFLFSISFFFLTIQSKADEKIVFIDLNFVFKESLFGIDFNDKFNSKSSEIKLKIDNFQNTINIEKNNLLNKKNLLSEDEYQNKLIDLENKIKEYNASIKSDENNLSQFQVKAKNEFLKELLPILENYSNINSISIIMKKESLLIAKDTLNISNDIIDLFNEKIKKVTIK